jgi:osmotically-inducible protein OsmY
MTVSTATLDIPVDAPARLLAPSAGAKVLELVQRRLRDSSYYYLRTVSCAFDEGVLTLRGRVPSFYLKQTVQVIAENVEGVSQVVNLVDVMYPANAAG